MVMGTQPDAAPDERMVRNMIAPFQVGQVIEVENIATETLHGARVLGVFEAGSYNTPRSMGGFLQVRMQGGGRRILYIRDIEACWTDETTGHTHLVTAW